MQFFFIIFFRNQAEMDHTCRGTISLHSAIIHTEDSCSFVINNGATRTFHIKAANEVERQKWVTALELAKTRAIRSMETGKERKRKNCLLRRKVLTGKPLNPIKTSMQAMGSSLESGFINLSFSLNLKRVCLERMGNSIQKGCFQYSELSSEGGERKKDVISSFGCQTVIRWAKSVYGCCFCFVS